MAQDFAKHYSYAARSTQGTSTPRNSNSTRSTAQASNKLAASSAAAADSSKLKFLYLQEFLGIKLPAWGWLASGLLIGSLVGYFIALAGIDNQLTTAQTLLTLEDSSQQVGANKLAMTKPAYMPEFEFYTELTRTEVEIPEIPAYKSTPREAVNLPEYLVQAGSFNNLNDAKRQLERISKLSLEKAKVSSVQTASGETWYRVQLGPEQDRRKLARTQNVLSKAGIDSLRIRVSTPAPVAASVPKLAANPASTTANLLPVNPSSHLQQPSNNQPPANPLPSVPQELPLHQQTTQPFSSTAHQPRIERTEIPSQRLDTSPIQINPALEELNNF